MAMSKMGDGETAVTHKAAQSNVRDSAAYSFALEEQICGRTFRVSPCDMVALCDDRVAAVAGKGSVCVAHPTE